MKNLCGFIFILFLATSCKKESLEMPTPDPIPVVVPIEASASYKIIITGKWKMPEHTVPAGNHFTPFVGLVHKSGYGIFNLGAQASLGAEDIAERGNATVLTGVMDNYISDGNALKRFSITLPNIAATDSTVVNADVMHSLISFESMIAPSPDWFAGIDSYNLIQNGKWVNDITLDVAGYDAGTEDGNVFGYNNPATAPQQNITYLSPSGASVIANGNNIIAPFATVRFIKQ